VEESHSNERESKRIDRREYHCFMIQLDSGAETCFVGNGAMIVNVTDRYVNVQLLSSH
jgi:hypothetical protein